MSTGSCLADVRACAYTAGGGLQEKDAMEYLNEVKRRFTNSPQVRSSGSMSHLKKQNQCSSYSSLEVAVVY